MASVRRAESGIVRSMDTDVSSQSTCATNSDRDALLLAAVSSRETVLALAAEAEFDESTAGGLTRRRVLEAAVGVFAEHGYEGCSMKMLAVGGGVKAPALYNYFASKQQILAESIELALGGFFQSVLNSLRGKPIESWLELTVREHATNKLENLALAQASDLLLQTTQLTAHLTPEDTQKLTAVQAEYMHFVRDLARAESPCELSEIEGTVAAFAIIAMCDRVSDWYSPAGPLTPEQVADYTWRFVARMLGLA